MKIECPVREFQEAWRVAYDIAPSKTPKDILKNVMLIAHGSNSCLVADDSEQTIRMHLTGMSVMNSGEILLPADKMNAILSELKGGTFTLSSNNTGKVEIICDRAVFKLQTADVSEFPLFEHKPLADHWSVLCDHLALALRHTETSVDDSGGRYATNGFCLDFRPRPEGQFMVSTDSKSLTAYNLPLTKSGEPQYETEVSGGHKILPVFQKKAISTLLLLLKSGHAKIAISNNAIDIETDQGRLTTKLIAGRFPLWEQVIDFRFPVMTIIPVKQWLATLRQAMIVRNPESTGVDFTFGKDTLEMRSEASDVGTSVIDMPIPYSDEEVTIRLDPERISRFLKVAQTESVEIGFTTANERVSLRSANCVAVVMPFASD